MLTSASVVVMGDYQKHLSKHHKQVAVVESWILKKVNCARKYGKI